MPKRKMGRFNVSELNYLKQNAELLTVAEIAKKLNRDPESISKWIQKNIGLTQREKKEIEGSGELKEKEYYKELKKQFTNEELNFLEYNFKKMWVQFKDDVFHTEEMQIIDCIKFDILMNRSLTHQMKANQSIKDCEMDLEEKVKTPLDCRTPDDRDQIFQIERQIASLRSSLETLGKEFKEYQQRKAAILKELKGTREQRVKNIEDSKQSFATLISRLTLDPAYRRAVGIEMETMRYAAEAEWRRLSEPIRYNDGVVDRPLLSAESVVLEESNEE